MAYDRLSYLCAVVSWFWAVRGAAVRGAFEENHWPSKSGDLDLASLGGEMFNLF